MSATATPVVTARAGGPVLRIGDRAIPVVLPRRRDPRLKLAAVIVTLQVLGQTVLGFKLSIAQILVTIGVCATIELALTLHRQGVLAWPASALLTGNSIAFILRASGTEHGDWWSLNGIEFFVLAAVLAMLFKHLVRVRGRHIFNPSNVALVWTLLVIGPVHVFPQYLWWGPLEAPVIAALAVIVAGAVWVLSSVRMIPMAAAFLLTFAALVGVLAASGREFVAIWADGPVSGLSYWLLICTSPELLIFVFFMMSDPRTAPASPPSRIAYGVGTAVVAAGLVAVQPTEFGIKVGVLASLTVTCALIPVIEAARRTIRARGAAAFVRGLSVRRASGSIDAAVVAAVIVAVAAPVNTTALAGDDDVMLIERGLTGLRNAQ